MAQNGRNVSLTEKNLIIIENCNLICGHATYPLVSGLYLAKIMRSYCVFYLNIKLNQLYFWTQSFGPHLTLVGFFQSFTIVNLTYKMLLRLDNNLCWSITTKFDQKKILFTRKWKDTWTNFEFLSGHLTGLDFESWA